LYLFYPECLWSADYFTALSHNLAVSSLVGAKVRWLGCMGAGTAPYKTRTLAVEKEVFMECASHRAK